MPLGIQKSGFKGSKCFINSKKSLNSDSVSYSINTNQIVVES